MIYEVDAPMYAPLHPGEFIKESYLAEWALSVEDLAIALDITPSVVRRFLTAKSRVKPEMALRLSKALGRSAESWLAMQQAYDLWHARRTVNLDNVRRIDRPAA
ncbi:HigA family addiction module antitoxin [uncultured Microbacterium sp.]|uniref:HigA family addiction module antitoxin n=1 Tax=uncultured Microbacterium sp. TaxID=191216 RepID=UPI002633A0B3|nr:HigA family addiction module antitoxin [uncultured Microbacterium sp.]